MYTIIYTWHPTLKAALYRVNKCWLSGYLTSVINSLRHLFTHKSSNLWLSAMCHKETFATGSFMAINRVVLDDEHGFSFGHKKALHFHVRLIVFRFIVTWQQSLNSSIDRSLQLYEQGVDENRPWRYVKWWFIWLWGVSIFVKYFSGLTAQKISKNYSQVRYFRSNPANQSCCIS